MYAIENREIVSVESRKLRVALSVLVGLAIIAAYALGIVALSYTARAATASVTTTWVIPTDKTIAVSYPTGLTAVRWSPTGSTFSRLAADSQTDGVAAYRVTNNGNVAVKVTGQFAGTPPGGSGGSCSATTCGVSEFLSGNSSSSGVPPTTLIQWVCTAVVDTSASPAGHCNVATNWTSGVMGVTTSLAVAGTIDKWCWSWGIEVVAGTNSATLTLTSA